MRKKQSESSWRLLDTNLVTWSSTIPHITKCSRTGPKIQYGIFYGFPIILLTDCCITIAFSNLKYDLRLWAVLQHPWWKVRKQNFALLALSFVKKKYSQGVLKKTPFKNRKSVCNLSLRFTGFCFVSGQLKSDYFVYGSCKLGEHQFMRAWSELRL